MTYHVDRFYAAVSVLAGDGHIKQRLIKAYRENLDDIVEDDLPRALKQSFRELRSRLHAVAPLNGEGPVCASVRKMSVKDASDCAAEVVRLYGDVIRQAENLQDPLPLHDDADKVPPFLVKSVS
ncbi:MAG TPA: hypothetical protein VK854_09420 [Woeseiaceae bacterium]|nr:hypothetical protein [Woeseiaceae bacterium]